METVSSINDLKINLRTLERYLAEGDNEHKSFAEDLTKKGKCFLSYRIAMK